MKPTTVYHRTLTMEETAIVKGFRLAGIFKTGKLKHYLVNVVCNTCKASITEHIVLAEYTDGAWIKEDFDYNLDEEIKVDVITVRREICKECEKSLDKIDVIEYYKKYILYEYNYITTCLKHSKEANPFVIFSSLVLSACRAAIYEDKPMNWRNYLPEQVLEAFRNYK